jgi:hypothetical protein
MPYTRFDNNSVENNAVKESQSSMDHVDKESLHDQLA